MYITLPAAGGQQPGDMSGRRRGMIDAAPKVRAMKLCCLRSRVSSSCERTLLGISSGQPCKAWSSCKWSRQPNLIAPTTTLMRSLMGAGAASGGVQGACRRDQIQQVVSIDQLIISHMEGATAWLRRPSMVLPRRLPTAVRKANSGDQLDAAS